MKMWKSSPVKMLLKVSKNNDSQGFLGPIHTERKRIISLSFNIQAWHKG